MRNLACLLVALCAAAALLVGAWKLGEHFAGPCDGAYTGAQTYHGTRIECWHGDVIKVYRGRR